MGIEKTKLLAWKSIYWIGMYVDIENHIKSCSSCLYFQQTQPREKIIHLDIPGKLWEGIGADIFTLNSKHYLCIVGHHSKFPIVKGARDMSTESLILTCKVIFLEYGLPKTIMSDAGGNFILDRFRQCCKCMSMEQIASSSLHHQSNGQVEACIKFIKCTMKKCMETNDDIHITLLQIRVTPL